MLVQYGFVIAGTVCIFVHYSGQLELEFLGSRFNLWVYFNYVLICGNDS